MKPKLFYSREEMTKYNIDKLNERGVTVEDIAKIAYNQQSRYNSNIDMSTCIESVDPNAREITLLTCTNGHKNRLVIKAREIKK